MYGVRVCVVNVIKETGRVMRHGTSNRRQRGRGNGGQRRNNGGQQRMQVFDSNGPDVRIRGTAHQVNEKYVALAKDAALAGDRILAESYLQYAEHYQRIINSWDENVQSNKNQNNSAEKKQAVDGNKAKASDQDLSLPASILGAETDVKAETRTAEATAQ